jgi:hypothetical protein
MPHRAMHAMTQCSVAMVSWVGYRAKTLDFDLKKQIGLFYVELSSLG